MFRTLISIIRSLRLCCRITTSVIVFSVCCVLEIWCGWVWVVSVLQAEACASACTSTSFSLQHGHHSNPAAPNLQHTTNREHNRRGNSTASCKLLMMDILMSETCWAHKKWNKIASDIKLVFCFSLHKSFLWLFEFWSSLRATLLKATVQMSGRWQVRLFRSLNGNVHVIGSYHRAYDA